MPGERQRRAWLIVSCLFILAFIIGIIQLVVFPANYQSPVSPIILGFSIGLYITARSVYALRYRKREKHARIIMGTDLAVCFVLVFLTGGIYSPYILCSLVPVINAGLLFRGRVTLMVTGISVFYMVVVHAWNPFLTLPLSGAVVSSLLFYVSILFFVAILPYLTNINLRKQMESYSIRAERKRLSHEFHDGIAQMMVALRWQVSALSHRLAKMNIDLEETRELTRSTSLVHSDTREFLRFLREGDDTTRSEPRYEPLRPDSIRAVDGKIKPQAKVTGFHPEAIIEAELLYICREALVNIRKHSGAHEIDINIQSTRDYLRLSITDDGCGFDALPHRRDGHNSYGLQVMRERAESVGGRFEIISVSQKGTEVRVEIPVKLKSGAVYYGQSDKSIGSR